MAYFCAFPLTFIPMIVGTCLSQRAFLPWKKVTPDSSFCIKVLCSTLCAQQNYLPDLQQWMRRGLGAPAGDNQKGWRQEGVWPFLTWFTQ